MQAIRILADDICLEAALNDTVAAAELGSRLPCRLHGTDTGIAYRCRTARGVYDPLEMCSQVQAGDICLCDGWLTLYYRKQTEPERLSGYMVVGRLAPEAVILLQALPAKAEFRLEKSSEGDKR
ncbi:MAG: cyclophilin-like fold protein [Lachnospiraceae bacterium]|jgi:hypothetical protein